MADDSNCSKRLILFAGPHRSAATSVEEFFYKYARGPQPNHKNGKTYHALANFRWPLVEGRVISQLETDEPYKRYNHLVTERNNVELRKEIIDSIKADWNRPDVEAVIFGGEAFDQISDESMKPLNALAEVVDALGTTAECTTVVLNYRVP